MPCHAGLWHCATHLGYCATHFGHYTTHLGHCTTHLGHHATHSEHCATHLGHCATHLGHCATHLGLVPFRCDIDTERLVHFELRCNTGRGRNFCLQKFLTGLAGLVYLVLFLYLLMTKILPCFNRGIQRRWIVGNPDSLARGNMYTVCVSVIEGLMQIIPWRQSIGF